MEKKNKILSNTACEVLALAVCELYPQVELIAGAGAVSVFSYDFYLEKGSFLLELIEERIRQIIKEEREIIRLEMLSSNAKKYLENLKIPSSFLPEEECLVELFSMGDFVDMADGPFLKNSRDLGFFKLMGVEKVDKNVQRITGVIAPSKKELATLVKRMKEYEKNSSLILGEEMQLFLKKEKIVLPKGEVLKEIFINFLKKELENDRFSFVSSFSEDKLEKHSILPYRRVAEIFPRSDFTHELIEHVFCSKEEIEAERQKFLSKVEELLKLFDFRYRIDTSKEIKVFIENGMGDWVEGPYLITRDLSFIKELYKRKGTYVIRRSLVGCLETYLDLILERHKGFPFWLIPEQVRIIVAQRGLPFVSEVLSLCRRAGIRACLDEGEEDLKFKIYRAARERVPYAILVGEGQSRREILSFREISSGKVETLTKAVLADKLKNLK